MTHPHIIRSLIALVALTFLGTTAWSTFTWLSSQPIASAAVLGASTEDQSAAPPTLEPYPQQGAPQALPFINAKEYVLYNQESGKVLVKSDTLEAVPIASTTKIMTTYLTSKYGNPDDVVEISQAGASQIGSLMGLYEGEKFTVRNLLYGTLMVSGNDGAYTLAEYVGGKLLNAPSATSEQKVARFVEEMNATAKKLGMSSTHYLDPAGLNDAGKSNALDLAKLIAFDYKNDLLATIMKTGQATIASQAGRTIKLDNSNRITKGFTDDWHYEGNLGGKTGNTPAAGHCLVTSATRNGITLTAAVLDAHSTSGTESAENEASAREAQKLLDYGFASFQWE